MNQHLRHGRKRSRSGRRFRNPCLQESRKRQKELKERLEDFASAQEKRAYIQGYADCGAGIVPYGASKGE